jgi:hypothetical protein
LAEEFGRLSFIKLNHYVGIINFFFDCFGYSVGDGDLYQNTGGKALVEEFGRLKPP